MKYIFCEKVIWYAMNGTIIDFLNTKHPNWNIKLIKSRVKNHYKQIITELPDIGSIAENLLRTCLSSGALWLAFYETCEEKIKDIEQKLWRKEKIVVISIFAKKVLIGILKK